MPREIPVRLRVFLWLVCLFTVTLQHDKRCARTLFGQVNKLLKIAPNQLSSRLYTPTSQDFESCPGAALRCFAEELDVLIEEWELNPNRNPNRETRSVLSLRIQSLASFFSKTESTCRQCELLTVENAETFLGNLSMILQDMNSQFCPRSTATSRKGF